MRNTGLNSTISRRSAGAGIALLVGVLCFGAISFATIAHAVGAGIYLYQGGTAVNISTQAYYEDPHVFYNNGTLIGTVDSHQYIENANGTVIGFVTIY